jgi:hypothetical protein
MEFSTRLEHFIHKRKYLCIKWSSLAELWKTGPNFSASLNRFKNKMFFSFCKKQSSLAKLDNFVWFFNGPVFGCPVPAKIDHLKSGLVRYLEVLCKILT